MILPISTDAPIYHWPWVTLVLIAVNLVTFLVTGFGHDYDGWILTYAHGLHPLEWLAFSFFHVNGMHLLTNAFFLWGFGIVVEGKLGWWKFLTLYLGIAVLGGAVSQGLMLHHKPRDLPRLQVSNPNVASQTASPTTDLPQVPVPTPNVPNQTPSANGESHSPLPTQNAEVAPKHPGLAPPLSNSMDDEANEEFTPDRPFRRNRDDEFSERQGRVSATDILWGNEHVFRKPGVKGASLMVYALLAITLVWAPRNEITCFVLKIPPGTFEAEYLYFCGFRVVIQVLYAWLTDFSPTEEFGHFFGVVSGFGTGTLLLKRGWVDCENWDLFAVMRGTHGNRSRVGGWQERENLRDGIATPSDGEVTKKSAKKKKTPFRASIYAADNNPKKKSRSSRSQSRIMDDGGLDSSEIDDSFLDDWKGFVNETENEEVPSKNSNEALSNVKKSVKAKPAKSDSNSAMPTVAPIAASTAEISKRAPLDPSTRATNQIRDALNAEQGEVALQIYLGHKASNSMWDLEEADFAALCDALHKAQHWEKAAPLMEQCLARFPENSLKTRVKLAGIYVEVQRRPRAALKLLKGISRKRVPEKLQFHFDAITNLARQLIDMSIEDRDAPG